jgi:hypothetical protein
MPNQTDKTLAQIRTELLTTFSAADRESYSHLVGWLRDTDVASHALKVGDQVLQALQALVGRLGGELRMASNSGALASQWRGPAKRSAMQSIPDRYFAEAAACDSVGVIATT